MPSRWMCLVIVAFWLATSGWFLYREVWLKAQTSQLPLFAIDLTDEAGGVPALWNVYHKGRRVGSGSSSVKKLDDRGYELTCEYLFATAFRNPDDDAGQIEFTKADLWKFLDPQRARSQYRISEDGTLRSMSAELTIKPLGQRTNVKINGDVKEGYLQLVTRTRMNEKELDALKLPPVEVRHRVLNPMHLLSRLPGLRVGQYGKIPLINPLNLGVPGAKDLGVPMLYAEVVEGELFWNGSHTPCYKIEYRQPGERVIASTWVRKSDDMVLQQEARHQNMDLVFRRKPSE